MFSEDSFFRRHKIITGFLIFVLLVIGFFASRMIGPHRFYKVDYVKTGDVGKPGILQVGVSVRDITPNLEEYDTYNDVDNDNKYKPSTGLASKIKGLKGNDTPIDRNKNGKFDPIWIAGFGSNRPAKGVHDPLSVRTIVVANNGIKVAMVTTDTIGIMHEKYITIRKSLNQSLGIDHVMFSSLHNHETPDTMGNWSGPIPLPWNFNHKHMDFVMRMIKESIEEAAQNLQPAEMICAQKEVPEDGYVGDTRKPIILDRRVSIMRFVKPGSENTIATMVGFGNHPETVGGSNPLLTADFCGYWRDGVEKGVGEPNGAPGIGGVCLYFQGMVGGLATQLRITVPHRDGVQKFKEDTFEKTEALGENMAIFTLKALSSPEAWKVKNPRVAVGAKTFYAPMAGLFKYAIALGLIHPGVYWGFTARSEVNVIRIGDVEIMTAPGELYPEIMEGGVEALPGRDFPIEPVEVPPIRSQMQGKMNFMVGLANDEIGYMIPKSQWDAVPPFVYDNEDQYGEENSGGPDVARIYHMESLALLKRFHEALGKVEQ